MNEWLPVTGSVRFALRNHLSFALRAITDMIIAKSDGYLEIFITILAITAFSPEPKLLSLLRHLLAQRCRHYRPRALPFYPQNKWRAQ